MSPARSGTGMVIAVKKLNPESVQGLQEWQSEINFLGRLSHPNLVRLIGYCVEDRELLLVYEFMAKGSLENHLFRKGSAYQPISWNLCLRIAIGAARGLAFLHSSERQIIYRDFKASNILLDTHYNAKLSDFGLAKNGPTAGESHVTTRVMGTYGYAAPEYVATGEEHISNNTRPARFCAWEPRDSLGPTPLFCGTDSLSRGLHRSHAMVLRYRLGPAVQSCGTGSVAHPGSA
ncbi:hypothetical protein OsJ_15794 [Oryza sativa Japonica Group]|uniref:non-specific serine/threonine protein kinase n=1 Tax=Oryza sativa subsp. japonica TaxID=39947 RepID=B9FC00_ORYSJ|nr:hypothetical protein OsJ_15794 [Oryza sativa Japonica Group]